MRARRIIFTDIDGVLLGGKAWFLPQNARARKLMLAGKRRAAMAQVSFDPCAVALLDRLLERTGARLVVHSGWRRTIGPTACRDVLVAHGIRPEHLHNDPACPMRPTSSKAEDIQAWLWKHGPGVPRPGAARHIPPKGSSARDQGVTPTPPNPTDNIDIDFLVIDDDALPAMPQIRVDGVEGFCAADYRVAAAFFGVEDRELGVYAVDPADFARVVRRLGSRIAAAEWLHRKHHDFITRAARLNVARLQRIAREGNAWIGRVGDESHFIAECRETIWRELKRARPAQ